MTRLTRDNWTVSAGPIRQPPSVASLIARDIATILLVPAAILIVVAWIAGDGFAVSVPVESGEDDDAPRSEEP